MTTNEKVTNKLSFIDGELNVRESYMDQDLNLVTIIDKRDRTLDQLPCDRTVSVTFIFRVEDDKLQLSRIFGNSENGGRALDTEKKLTGGFKKTYKKRSLLDDEVFMILKTDYPELRIDTRRIRDRIQEFLKNK